MPVTVPVTETMVTEESAHTPRTMDPREAVGDDSFGNADLNDRGCLSALFQNVLTLATIALNLPTRSPASELEMAPV